MAQIVKFNGVRYSKRSFVSGRCVTSTKITLLEERPQVSKVVHDKHAPRVYDGTLYGPRNVSFGEAPKAFARMKRDEKEQWLEGAGVAMQRFLAPWWCKDCEDQLLAGKKPSKDCRHVRRWRSMPIIEKTLDDMARDARRRANNRWKALQMRLSKKKRSINKVYARECGVMKPRRVKADELSFGEFETEDPVSELRAEERMQRLEARLMRKRFMKSLWALFHQKEEDEFELAPWVGENKLPRDVAPEHQMYLDALAARTRFIIETLAAERTGVRIPDMRAASLCLRGESFPVEDWRPIQKVCWSKNASQPIKFVRWEMDNGKTETLDDSAKPVIKSGENVSLAMAEEVPVQVDPVVHRMDQFTHNEAVDEFKSFTSRLTHLTDFTWSQNGIKLKDGAAESKLVEINVFSDIYKLLNKKNSPLVKPFKHYRFGRFDIELTFKVSSTIMQAGTLQIALTYFKDKLQSTDLLDAQFNKVNAAILSQRPHEVLTAHDTTEVTLKIPFRHWQTMLNLEANPSATLKKLGHWNYATVHMNVLNDLMVASSSCTGGSVAGQIYVRLSNVQFGGMVADAKNEMFSTAAFLLASKYLADPNRDLPGAYENAPRLQPTMSQSFSHGRANLDHRDVLRLDPSVQTPHPEGIDNFSGDYIKKVPGLLDVVRWEQNKSAGEVLYQVECTPLLQKDKYIKYKDAIEKKQPASYVMPPVAVWASDKMSFTGGLVLTINVCTTKFSAGMLEVIYIPGNQMPKELDVTNYMHVVLDIKEQKTFHVATPSIINTPAWYRRYVGLEIGEDYDPPGFLVVRIRQQLASTCESVPPDALVNFYISGDDNLQCHVLTQPCIGPHYIANNMAPKISAVTRHEACSLGTWAQAVGEIQTMSTTIKHYAPTIRYSHSLTGAVNVVEIRPPLKVGIYKAEQQVRYNGKNKDFLVDYYLITNTTYDQNYYAFPIPVATYTIQEGGINMKKYFEKLATKPSLADIATHLGKIAIAADGDQYIWTDNNYSSGEWIQNQRFIPMLLFNVKYNVSARERLASTEFELVDAMNQNGVNVGDVIRMAPPISGDNNMIFGERPVDIKDACRRKNMVGVITLHGNSTHFIADEVLPVCLQYNANIQGLLGKLKLTNAQLYASGFLGFRGGLVYTIIPLKRTNGLLGAQHVPDLKRIENEHNNAVVGGVVANDVLLSYGYAQQWTDMSLNSNLTIEVPFYRNARWIFAPQTKNLVEPEYTADCNGALKLFSTASETITCGVWVSFADDASLTYFQGFPPMSFVDENLIPMTTNQIGEKLMAPLASKLEDIEAQLAPTFLGINTAAASVTDLVDNTATILPDTMTKLSGAADAIKTFADNANETITQMPKGIMDFFSNVRSKGTEIYDFLAQFAHVLIDIKSWKHWALFIATMVLRWGVITREKFMTLVDTIMKFFDRNKDKLVFDEDGEVMSSSNPFRDDKGIKHTKNESSGDIYATLGALLISGISAHATTKDKFWYLKSIPRLAVITKTTATGFKWVKEFIVTVIDFVGDAIERLAVLWNPNVKLLSQGKCVEIKAAKWYESAVPYLNPFALESIKSSPERIAELNELVLWGQKITVTMHDMKLDQRAVALVTETLKALNSLKQKLAGDFLYGPPMEPFCVWMSGPGGVGKTYVQDHFLVNLLNSQNICVENREMTFTVPAKGDYWERCNNQPVCVYDDFLVYKDDQTTRDQITTFLALKNKAPFNPPIAECEGKKKLYNPDIVWVNANWDEIKLSSLASKAAFHRRRDVIVRVRLNDKFSGKASPTGRTYSRYAEIPAKWYEECCQNDEFKMYKLEHVKSGSTHFCPPELVSHETYEKYYKDTSLYKIAMAYIIPSPHLVFDIYTTEGDDGCILVKEDLNSVEAAKILNERFAIHRTKQLALMKRQVALEEAIKSGMSLQDKQALVIPATKHTKEGNKPLWYGNFKCSEVMCVEKPRNIQHVQEEIEKLLPSTTTFEDKYFEPKFDPHLHVEDIPAISKKDNAVLTTRTMVVNKLTNFKDSASNVINSFKRTRNEGPQEEEEPKPSTSKLGFEESAQALEDGNYDSSCMMSVEDMIAESHRRSELETPKKVIDGEDFSLAYPVNRNVEYIIAKREEVADYMRECAGSSDELLEFVKEVNELRLNREKVEQLRSTCLHHLFDPRCMYEHGFFYGYNGQGEKNKIVISDQPCPFKTTHECPWHDRLTFQRDMSNFLGAHPEAGDYIYGSVDETDAVRLYPFYFRERAKHVYSNILLMREADKNWLSYFKKVVVKDIPEALLTAWNWMRAHAKMIIVFVGVVCTVVTTAIGLKNSLNFQRAYDKANMMHKISEHMTPEEKKLFRDAFGAISEAQMLNDTNKLEAAMAVLHRLQNNVNSRMLGFNNNEIINSGSQPIARTKLGSKASTILRSTKLQRASEDSVEALQKKIRRNTFWLTAADKNAPMTLDFGTPMRCLGICEHWALLPTHYLEWWSDQDHEKQELRGIVGNGVFKWPSDWLDVTIIPNSGLCVVEVPKQIPPFANILKNIPYSAEDFDFFDLSNITLVETTTSENQNLYFGKSQITMFMSSGDTPSQKSTFIQAGFEYNIKTMPGFCGSVLMCGDKIIGMHVSGDEVQKGPQRLGYSSAIIGEELYPLFGLVKDRSKIYDYYELYGDEELQSTKSGKVLPKTSVIPIGTLNKNRKELSIFVPGKTSWQKSVMHGVFPSRKSPAVLSPKDERIVDAPFSPLLEAINKHGLVPTPLPKVLFGIAKDYWKNKHLQLMKPYGRTPGLLSLEQAICGIPELNYYDKLEFNSSEGWPFCKARPPGAHNKQWLFETEMRDNKLYLKSIFPPLKSQILNKIEETRENLNGFNVVVDLLKDELKPNEKVLIPGKTRCFSGAAVDEVIRFKMFFQDYVANYMKYRFHNSSAIGMSCVGSEPTVLVNHMISKGFTKHCCGDYSDFGPAFEPNCGSVFYEIAIEWYAAHTPQGLRNDAFESDQIARKNMGYSFTNPKHLAVDTIYQTMCGMSSGCPATAPCNTDVNKMYIAIAWLAITKKDMVTFEDNVILVCYGDDIWFSVSDEYCEIFNNETLHHFFKQFEIKYTDNTKDKNNIRKYCSLEEVEFLKRRYIPHPTRRGEYLAALDKVSIEECCQWIRKDASNLDLTKQICESAIELAYSHGKEYYAHVVKTIREKWQTVLNAPPLTLRSWDELDKIFYNELSGKTQTYDDSWEAPMNPLFCELQYAEGGSKSSCSHLGETCPHCCAPKLSTGVTISGHPTL